MDDTIDETDRLAGILEMDSAVAATLNLTVRSLSGDHIRPLRQEVLTHFCHISIFALFTACYCDRLYSHSCSLQEMVIGVEA